MQAWFLDLLTRRPSENGPAGESILRSGYFPAGQTLLSRMVNQLYVAISMLIVSTPGRSIRHFAPDVIVGTVPALPTAFISYLYAKRFDRPYIIDLRDAWPDLMAESDDWDKAVIQKSSYAKNISKFFLAPIKAVANKLLKFSLKKASGIIVTSEQLMAKLIDDREMNSEPLIPIACTRNVFPAQAKGSEPIAASYKTPGREELRVLYAGTIGRAQNLSNALQAAAIARTEGVMVKLRFVGAGAAKSALVKRAKDLAVDAEFLPQATPEEMGEHYAWADTALVHLTNWEPLNRAVPSKTYELMTHSIHISAVVSGETAEIIRQNGAGDVVPPEKPALLASLWVDLARKPERLVVGSAGKQWVIHQRDNVAISNFLNLLAAVGTGNEKQT